MDNLDTEQRPRRGGPLLTPARPPERLRARVKGTPVSSGEPRGWAVDGQSCPVRLETVSAWA